MLDPKFFCDLFKVTGFDILRIAFFNLYHEILVSKDFDSAVHGIIFIFGYGHPFGFMPAMKKYFLHIYR
jgi:hypothetical protein